jgi:glycosyltransferase involved in cell wall biosynthesis
MGAGVCVLTSDIPENREVVEDAGFTFKRGNVDDLERMLRLLIENSQLRQATARAAQERVRERYLWREIAGQIDQTYRQLFGPNPFPLQVRPPRENSKRRAA